MNLAKEIINIYRSGLNLARKEMGKFSPILLFRADDFGHLG